MNQRLVSAFLGPCPHKANPATVSRECTQSSNRVCAVLKAFCRLAFHACVWARVLLGPFAPASSRAEFLKLDEVG